MSYALKYEDIADLDPNAIGNNKKGSYELKYDDIKDLDPQNDINHQIVKSAQKKGISLSDLLSHGVSTLQQENETKAKVTPDMLAGLLQTAQATQNIPRNVVSSIFGANKAQQLGLKQNPLSNVDFLNKLNPNANQLDKLTAEYSPYAFLGSTGLGEAIASRVLPKELLGGITQTALGSGLENAGQTAALSILSGNPVSNAGKESLVSGEIGAGVPLVSSVLKVPVNAAKRLINVISESPQNVKKISGELYNASLNEPEKLGAKINPTNFNDTLMNSIVENMQKADPKSNRTVKELTKLFNTTKDEMLPSEAQGWIQEMREAASKKAKGNPLSTKPRDWPDNKFAAIYQNLADAMSKDVPNSLHGQGFHNAAETFPIANEFHKNNVVPITNLPVNKKILSTQILASLAGLGMHGGTGYTLLGGALGLPALLHEQNPLLNVGKRFVSNYAGGPKSIVSTLKASPEELGLLRKALLASLGSGS